MYSRLCLALVRLALHWCCSQAEQTWKVMSPPHTEDCNAELVSWLQQSDRKKQMVQDKGFASFLKRVQTLPGIYSPPCKKEVDRAYVRRGDKGRENAKKWVNEVKAEGLKVSIAGDIVSSGDLSILAITGYATMERYSSEREFSRQCPLVIEEKVLAAVKFNTMNHTGDNILQLTRDELQKIGLEDLYVDVFRKCSDGASNMKKGWGGFEGGKNSCAIHKLERCGLHYYDDPETAHVAANRNKLAGHLHMSLLSQDALRDSQKKFELPERRAVQSCATRWRSEHDQSRWYRQNEPALNDARYLVEGPPGFSEHMLTKEEFILNNEEEVIMNQQARVELALEPTITPTSSLVIPLADALMSAMSTKNGIIMTDGTKVKAVDMHPASLRSRTAVYEHIVAAFETEVDSEWLTTMQIATLLDPTQKAFNLRHKSAPALRKFKKEAVEKAKTMFNMSFKEIQVENAEKPEKALEFEGEDPAPKRRKLDPSMKRDYAVDLAGLLGREDEEDEDEEEDVASAKDEWALYLEEPQIAPTADVLKWWWQNKTKYPRLYMMARQVLAVPACSSGVERLFSKLARNYDDSQKNRTLDNMCDLLFARNLE